MNLKTIDQVRQEFSTNGIPVSNWAAENNFTPQEVYKLLNGQTKGNFGRSHKIAVALGLKRETKVTV